MGKSFALLQTSRYVRPGARRNGKIPRMSTSYSRRAANLAKTLIRKAISAALLPTGKINRDRLYFELAQEMVPVKQHVIDGRTLRFVCPSYDALYRFEKFFVKEPETLQWIDGFHKDEVLWDIGANVGVYSLYAAIKGCRVIAFEPSAANYWLLNRNCSVNDLDERITAYCVAFSGKMGAGVFNMADMDLGGACYSFGTRTDQFDYPGLGQRDVVFHQGTIGFSLDEFVRLFNPPFPNHLKIDVDGLEQQIIAGGTAMIGDARLRSVSIEMDRTRTTEVRFVTEVFEQCGFRLAQFKHAPEFDHGVSKDSFNYVFRR
jgi:FkbM family methyltransferase